MLFRSLVALEDRSRRPPEFVGKVTLLNFWGTWCPPCRLELPGLVRLAARLRDNPAFQVVAVSCGGRPPEDLDALAEETAAFLDKTFKPSERTALVAWADPSGRTRQICGSLYGFGAFPTTYLVGPDATIRQVWVGYRPRDEADVARAVVSLLKEVGQPPAVPQDDR